MRIQKLQSSVIPAHAGIQYSVIPAHAGIQYSVIPAHAGIQSIVEFPGSRHAPG
jgi:hypothetical protein